MAKILRRAGGQAREWELGLEPLTIGRRAENDIVIADDFASGRHARIGYADDGWYIEDLRSSNGTLVNGQQVARQALQHGDLILIGEHLLEFLDPDAAPTRRLPSRPVQPAAVAPAAPRPAAPAESTARTPNLLDELVGVVRQHRERERLKQDDQQAQFDAEWEQAISYAEQLRERVAADPRVKHFGVSRRHEEVMIRVQQQPGGALRYILLSKRHPDDRSDELRGLWIRRNGELDRCYMHAQEAIGELVKELAFLIP